MTIRNATYDDAPQIMKIWNHYIVSTIATFNSVIKTQDQISALIDEKATENHPVFVSTNNGNIVGFATYGAFRGGVGYTHTKEHSIMLDHHHIGGGRGRTLMDAIEQHASENAVHCLIAGLSEENIAGISFHERLGYQTITTIKEVGFKFERWHDLVLMQKML